MDTQQQTRSSFVKSLSPDELLSRMVQARERGDNPTFVELREEAMLRMLEITAEAAWPQIGDEVWFVNVEGNPISMQITEDDDVEAMLANGIYKTIEEADAEAFRRESRAKQKWVPKLGERWFYWNSGSVLGYPWTNDHIDFAHWRMGNVHKTEEEAQAWGEKYAQHFEVKPNEQ